MNITIEDAQKDKALIDEFVVESQGLVRQVIWNNFKYAKQNDEFDDLFQIGCIGLIKAARNFNPDFKVTFSTYAVPMIHGEIQRYKRDQGISQIHMPRKELTIYYKYVAMRNYMNDEEICDKLNISIGELSRIINATEGITSLQQPTNVEGNGNKMKTFEELIPGNFNLEGIVLNKIENLELIDKAREVLSVKEFEILLLHISGKVQTTIAKKVGMSQANISRVIKRISEKCINAKQLQITNRFKNKPMPKEIKEVMSNLEICPECRSILIEGSCSNKRCSTNAVIVAQASNIICARTKENAQKLLKEGKTTAEIALLMGFKHEKYFTALAVRWGVIEKKEDSKYKPKEEIPIRVLDNPILSGKQMDNKTSLLKPRVLVGQEAEYEIVNEGLIIRDIVNKGNQLVVNLELLGRFISELKEIESFSKAV